MIVTTSSNPNPEMLLRVNDISNLLGIHYVKRGKLSIGQLMEKYAVNEIIVVEKEHSKLYSKDLKQPFFFHPSMAVLRINRIKQGDNDLMIKISNLKPGDTFLDCTLGLASDSLVASYVVGKEGKIVGIESQPILAALVKDGLNRGWKDDQDLNDAMKRIEVVNGNHYEVLSKLPENSFDVVYFDPMFRKGIKSSAAISPLRTIANPDPISYEAVIEAKRVAKKKVILKENIKSNEFERLGFERVIRSSSTTYGVITMGEEDE
ncbi:hypothetical protein BHF71_06120 [Vulcanibacillus modesticaldus]|uniref:SAM-dependent methyltransferase n=1 Tax=Vulcanibacillus modesticaldus TaxID=337097 RepID=A0A1D2YWY8_9BACI|nr:class I SAM-dependent methyltransferase [Vulcanibacillus modesticaldus]OEG00176.1 hypothetical protein BHF71_06120 [Vulcanibacillus modesticaldus]